MKKTLITIITALLVLSLNAQDFRTWEHTGNYAGDYHFSQCYDIVQMSDGNFVVREAIFDNINNDIGYMLHKITPDGEPIDSLFIGSNSIHGLHPLLRDPYNTNSNIMTSFYEESANGIGKKYYKAMYFNDDLEITGEVVAEYPDTLELPTKFMVDGNNDIVCRTKVSDEMCHFVKLGLDGEIKTVSKPIPSQNTWEHLICHVSNEPLLYGLVWFTQNNRMTLEILDSEFNTVNKKTFLKIGDWYCNPGHPYMQVCGIGDGRFVLSLSLYKGAGTQRTAALGLIVINSELEIEKEYIWGEYDPNTYPFSNFYVENKFVNNTIVAAAEGIYVVWENFKGGNGQVKNALMVTYFDIDLNPVWRTNTLQASGTEEFVNYGLTLTDEGGVALSGWRATPDQYYYDSKEIYAIMFDNDWWSAEENTAPSNPFVCYPNPSSGVINLSFAENTGCQSIEIYTIDGRLLHSQSSNFETVDMSNLESGIYIIKVRLADGREYSKRVVKE